MNWNHHSEGSRGKNQLEYEVSCKEPDKKRKYVQEKGKELIRYNEELYQQVTYMRET